MGVHYGSIFRDECECIQALLELHNNGNDIELDPMYNRGRFYINTVNKPRLRYDINASANGYDAEDGDATQLPLDDGSVSCMILDPPFLFGVHGKQREYHNSNMYTMFEDFDELEACYRGVLKEAYRVLCKNGLLIFKCQDYTDGKTTMTHCFVYEWAKELGFYAKDIAIFESPIAKVYNSNLKQRHLRKTHCYFWVFVKKKPKGRRSG